MSSRPSAVRRHRKKHGEMVAWKQWEKQAARNPRERAKLSVHDAIVIIVSEGPPEGTNADRVKAMVMLLTLSGTVSAPKPTREELRDVARRLILSDDPDDISMSTIALHASKREDF